VADAAVGTWHEAPSHKEPRRVSRSVGVPTQANHNNENDRFAVRLADASMNKVLPQGSFAVLEHADERTDFRIGDIVYVERLRDGMTELSLRRVASTNAQGIKLTTHSVDPRFRQELTYPPRGEAEKLRILGRLVGKYEDFQPS